MTIELDRTALETEYRALMGLRNWDKVDRRWSAKRLTKEIDQLKAAQAAAAAAQAAAAAKKAADEAAEIERKAILAARAASRGTFEEFAAKAYGDHGIDETEQKLAYLARRVADHVKPGSWEAKVAKFSADLLKHPTHTMSWSVSMFSAAAEYELAKFIKELVEAGHTYAAVKDELTRRVITGAGHPSRSTSPTSNLMNQETTAKMASLIRDYGF